MGGGEHSKEIEMEGGGTHHVEAADQELGGGHELLRGREGGDRQGEGGLWQVG